jgi:hypothetical protein
MTITFTDQLTCADVNQCIDDLERSGAEVLATSLFQEEQYCEIIVNISDESTFRPLFELTNSWLLSDY